MKSTVLEAGHIGQKSLAFKVREREREREKEREGERERE